MKRWGEEGRDRETEREEREKKIKKMMKMWRERKKSTLYTSPNVIMSFTSQLI